MRICLAKWFVQTGSFQALVSVVEDDRLAQSRQSELVRREKEATQAVKKLEADLSSERADHARQVHAGSTPSARVAELLVFMFYDTTTLTVCTLCGNTVV